MKPIEVENVGVVNIFGKSFLGQQKIGKTPFSAINAIFSYFQFFYYIYCIALLTFHQFPGNKKYEVQPSTFYCLEIGEKSKVLYNI